jgi:hypothetical protein
MMKETVHNFVNKLRTTGLLIDKKQKHNGRVLAEEKLGDIGARLANTGRKSLKSEAQETGMSKSGARRATKLLKLRAYKATGIHAHLAASQSSWQASSLYLVSTVCSRR